MQFLPLRGPQRQGIARAAALGLALAVAGCGGSEKRMQTVSGAGFSFSAPAGWRVANAGGRVVASPREGATELVSVLVFRLERPYREGLWPKVVLELDGVARQLAAELHGELRASRTISVAGRRARQYEIAFSRSGKRLVERIAFVLDGPREFELLCRFEEGQAARSAGACAGLLAIRLA